MPGECHCPAPILLCWLGTTSTFTLSFPHCHSWGLQQLRMSGHLSADTLSPVALLAPRRGYLCHDSPQHFPTCHGAVWKGTKPEGSVVMEKAALTQSPHSTLRKTNQAAWGGGAAKTRSTALLSTRLPSRREGRIPFHPIPLRWKKPFKICSANNFILCG